MREELLFIAGFILVFCVAGSMCIYSAETGSTPILLLIGILLMLPKVVCVIANRIESVYNEDEDDL